MASKTTSSTFQTQTKYNKLPISDFGLMTSQDVLPFWNENRKIGIADPTGKTIVNYVNYAIDKSRLKSVLDREEEVYEKYGKYQFLTININSLSKYKHKREFYTTLLKRLNNYKRKSAFDDFVYKQIWSIEKGIKNKKWHAHIAFFIRPEIDVDRIGVHLKEYIEDLSIQVLKENRKLSSCKDTVLDDWNSRQVRVWCNWDKVYNTYDTYRGYHGEIKKKYKTVEREWYSEIGKDGCSIDTCRLGIVNTFYQRNIVRIRLLYFCKIVIKEGRDRNGSRDYLRHRDIHRDVGYHDRLFGSSGKNSKVCAIENVRYFRSSNNNQVRISLYFTVKDYCRVDKDFGEYGYFKVLLDTYKHLDNRLYKTIDNV